MIMEKIKRSALYGAIIATALGVLVTLTNLVLDRPTWFLVWSIVDIPLVAIQGAIYGAMLGVVIVIFQRHGGSPGKRQRFRFRSWLFIGALAGLVFGIAIGAFIVIGPLQGDVTQALPVGVRGVTVGVLTGSIGGAIMGFIRRPSARES